MSDRPCSTHPDTYRVGDLCPLCPIPYALTSPGPSTEPEIARWNGVVLPDEDSSTLWALCTIEEGRPIALALDEDAELFTQDIRDARIEALNNHLMRGAR